MKKRKSLLGLDYLSLFMAIVLAAVRLFMIYHAADYSDVLDGDFFTYFTLALWPGSFYLTILQAEEPVQRVVVV